ncbi:class A beta-lactamase [Sinorhizobium numidicum]|uniref:Beta-lactamase n=1 Tax=Sinorhizobium numidicum TaxID=680248 RepID=A0ABY8CSA7_9HYPH|nr:class A beta-lactamase [Sinorhizobium numidicum]WEX75532.1 class A beta-lactamase [Sinorhizobium numidicum]WEX81529.1 class A beta-lactamase [Sinorhizobium numidicum]
MTISISRRAALAGSLLAVPALASLQDGARARTRDDAEARLAELERAHGGRIGVAVLNLATGKRVGHRIDERFLMCSTFKALTAALVLARVDREEEQLDRRIFFSRKDLVDGSPVTEARANKAGITITELCDAMVTRSDNTAANLLLASLGGPGALTAYVRSLGDDITRLDRIEPALNEHDGPGDLRDTTTPAAMLETLRKLIFGDALSKPSRSQLAAWLITNKTGDTRLRAGFPENWLVGDKTGGNGNKSGNNNDIAVAWPSERAPIIVAAYCQIPAISAEERNAVHAEIGRIAAQV